MIAPSSNRRKARQSGVAIVVFSLLVFTVLIPMVALAIDGGILYLLHAKLSQACDAAALAGGRNLNNGNDIATQTANAEATMTSFFNANFPPGTWGTSNTQLNLNVVGSGLHTRTTTIDATVTAPLYFMRVVGKNSVTLAGHGQASRKDVNMMLVLDRSNSMQTAGVCSQMVTQARSFISSFTNGRDQIGLITFMSGSNLDYAPTVNFKTNTPSLDTTLSNLVCGGNTGSAQALWQAYQQLVTINQPGALNLIVFFTDGQPNGVSFDFSGLNLNAILPIKTQTDTRYGTGTGSYRDTTQTYSMPASSCAGPLLTSAVMAQETLNSTPPVPVSVGMFNSASGSISTTSESVVSGTNGRCNFANSSILDMLMDIAYIPSQDHWGNSTNTGYKPVTLFPTGTPYANQIRPDVPANIPAVSTNAADSAASRIRADTLIQPVIFTIGLGGTDVEPIDQVFLERVANDQRSPIYNSAYQAGQFVYASDINQLGIAFQSVASQILRLSQ
jgi:Flp pilus assembly protein TadG